MRLTLLALVLVLAACSPTTGSWNPGSRTTTGWDAPSESTPTTPPATETPIGDTPVHRLPIEPQPELPPVEPQPEPEPPVEENESETCRTLELPDASALERIEKCPRERAHLTWRENR
jgi:hypothetical protein